MKVLIVGSGGRENTLAWKASLSPKVDKIYCAPGNAGIAKYAECVDIGAMEFERLASFAEENAIDLAKVMRRELKARGIKNCRVVYSKEIPVTPLENETAAREREASGRRSIPGSVSFVPPAAGLILAGEVIKDLCIRK